MSETLRLALVVFLAQLRQAEPAERAEALERLGREFCPHCGRSTPCPCAEVFSG